MHALDSDIKQGNIESNPETQTDFPKWDWFSLVTQETQTDRRLKVDAMTQTDRVYTSDWNGNMAQECINTDMIKLYKDEMAFLRCELSRELRSNNKTIKVLLEQNSYYQVHQRRCDEFQHYNQNQSIVINIVKVNAHNLIHHILLLENHQSQY